MNRKMRREFARMVKAQMRRMRPNNRKMRREFARMVKAQMRRMRPNKGPKAGGWFWAGEEGKHWRWAV